MNFHPEFSIPLAEQNQVGVLLVNLGTPEAPTPEAVRPYLREGDAEGLRRYLHQTIAEKPEHHYLHDKKVGLITNLSMTGG